MSTYPLRSLGGPRWRQALDAIAPGDFTVHNAVDLLGDRDPWAGQMVAPQTLSADLVAEGHGVPVGRVAAMHEGKRRKRAAAKADDA